MSPTCTLPYEVLFELVNDTAHSATMQVVQDDAVTNSRPGATILVHPRDNLSLVLTAGILYKYVIRQREKEVNLL